MEVMQIVPIVTITDLLRLLPEIWINPESPVLEVDFQEDQSHPDEYLQATVVTLDVVDDGFCAGLNGLADRFFYQPTHQRVALDAARDGVAVVSNRAIIRERDRAREQVVAPQQPLRQNVLVVEGLVFGFRAADEAAIADAEVVDKSLRAEKDDLAGSIDDRTVLDHVRHDDLPLTASQLARVLRRGACAAR
jgi:hypothetical protein